MKTIKKKVKLIGLESHAIKHLREFDSSAVISICEKMIQMFSEYKGDIYTIYGSKSPTVIEKKEELLTYLTHNVMQNTLDFINDKIINTSKLIGLEPKFKEYIQIFTNIYEKILNTKINNAIDLTITTDEKLIKNALNSKKIIKFDVHSDSSYHVIKDNIIYFDLKDNTFIVYRNGQFHTMFKKKTQNAFSLTIDKYIISNPVLNTILQNKKG